MAGKFNEIRISLEFCHVRRWDARSGRTFFCDDYPVVWGSSRAQKTFPFGTKMAMASAGFFGESRHQDGKSVLRQQIDLRADNAVKRP
jgi:hypothetical protein